MIRLGQAELALGRCGGFALACLFWAFNRRPKALNARQLRRLSARRAKRARSADRQRLDRSEAWLTRVLAPTSAPVRIATTIRWFLAQNAVRIARAKPDDWIVQASYKDSIKGVDCADIPYRGLTGPSRYGRRLSARLAGDKHCTPLPREGSCPVPRMAQVSIAPDRREASQSSPQALRSD